MDAGKTRARRVQDINLALTKPGETVPMKRLIPLILLVACGAQPAPVMVGAQRAEVTRDGRQYSVFWTAKLVEVIRLGYARNGEHAGIRQTMIALIPQVTHCKLSETSLTGDSGELRGAITCPQAP